MSPQHDDGGIRLQTTYRFNVGAPASIEQPRLDADRVRAPTPVPSRDSQSGDDVKGQESGVPRQRVTEEECQDPAEGRRYAFNS